jgi:type IV secretory pathway TraG/TraD family ATPase VirD4
MLGALLHAAGVSGRGIADVRNWVLREDLTHPQALLLAHGEQLPADVLEGLARAPERTVSSICATASSVLSVYNSASALDASARPNFDPALFVRSGDSVYVVAPSIQQDRLAPLVVGLLEDIRHAAYANRRAMPIGLVPRPVFWALDEAANIAPIHGLPSIVSEGGGQGVQVLVCFQDLSQARARWGEAAQGFLSLFGSKIVLPGIGDYGTLHDLSAMIGTWDRPYLSVSDTWSRSQSWGPEVPPNHGRTVGGSITGSTQREAILSEGDISNIPLGNALFLARGSWRLLQLEPYFASPCWRNVLAHAPSMILLH